MKGPLKDWLNWTVLAIFVLLNIIVIRIIYKRGIKGHFLESADRPAEEYSKLGCEKLGGTWGRFGKWATERCDLPTKDMGKECVDQKDCQSDCLAEITEEQKQFLTNGGALEMHGKCSARTMNFGCYPSVRNGKAQILCID